ncbi:MAG: type II toxin-antitoxin system HicB family antitoxin [Spirochaetaceae bacterium]|nr:type II toxin-antitoxin system HicB family antitoxin [Spirochaetaceae bacterium]
MDEGNYSGKFVLRIPRTLHARLAQEAERGGVSLNQSIRALSLMQAGR